MAINKTILLLDGDTQSAQDLESLLKASDDRLLVKHAKGIDEGLSYVAEATPDLVLLDGELLDKADFEPFKNLLDTNNIPYLLLSDKTPGQGNGSAGNSRAAEYLVKYNTSSYNLQRMNPYYLQKTINSTLELAETQQRLNHVFDEYSGRVESFSLILDILKEGVIIVNKESTVCYSNSRAQTLMKESSVKNKIISYLKYRDVEEEEIVEMKGGKNQDINIRINNFSWNGEASNIFIIEQREVRKEAASAFNVLDVVGWLLNAVDENILLLKEKKIIFANKSALKALRLQDPAYGELTLKDVFTAEGDFDKLESAQLQTAEKRNSGKIKLSQGTVKEVKWNIRNLNLGEDMHQLFSFETVESLTEMHVPGSRSDQENTGNDEASTANAVSRKDSINALLDYVQLIANSLTKGKYNDAIDFAEAAKNTVDDIEKLLADIKIYIGLNDREVESSRVSMKLLLNRVLDFMKPEIEAAGAEINISDLPDANGDAQYLEYLLKQLIGNALKFRKKSKKAVIDIGFDRSDNDIIFCVRDSGIGISKKYHEKVFQVLQQLNAVDEYPGTGLGLAICKRIVQMMGGEIWVEGLPGIGSNFYFTLRAA